MYEYMYMLDNFHRWRLNLSDEETLRGYIYIPLDFNIAKRQRNKRHLNFFLRRRKGEQHCKNIIDTLDFHFISPLIGLHGW